MDNSVKDLDVFVMTYNRATLLQQTLISLCNQTARGFNIIVLDNGSTDNTPEIVSGFKSYGVELRRNEYTTPVFENFNRAKALTTGKWTMVFHDDDLLHPDYIETAMNLISKHDDIALIGSALANENNPGNDFWPDLNDETLCCRRASDFAALLYRGFSYHFGSTIYKTDLFKATPVEDSIYGKIADRPLLLDIAGHGATFVFKNAYVKYRLHPNQDHIDCETGPFINQVIALNRKYLYLLGSSPFTRNGRTFLSYNYKYLRSCYGWANKSNIPITQNQFIKTAVKNNGSTVLAICYGKFIIFVEYVIHKIIKICKLLLPGSVKK